jgi:N-acyl-D-amino-acid deacylase
MEPTILIKNGMIMDGTGKKAFRSDLMVRGDRIEAVEVLKNAGADLVIDAGDRVVSPGFIDAHTHLDFFMAAAKHPQVMERWIRQGVTTIVAGNCGFSPAPITNLIRPDIGTYFHFALPREGLAFEWSRMGEYFAHLEGNGLGFNLAVFTGHNTLRAGVMGYQARFAEQGEIESMKTLLKQSLDEGSCGLSLGLFYVPGVYSRTEEISELASVLRDYNAPMATHTRGLTQLYHYAVAEVIDVAEKNQIPLQLSHHAGGDSSKKKSDVLNYNLKKKILLKLLRMMGDRVLKNVALDRNWVRMESLRLIREARERGVVIGHDNMPWMCGPSTALSLLPPWLFDGGLTRGMDRLLETKTRNRVIHEMKTVVPQWPTWEHHYWTDNFFTPAILLSGFSQPQNLHFENQSLKKIAGLLGEDPYQTFINLILEERGKLFVMGGLEDDPAGDDLMCHLLSDPDCSIMTDVVGVDYDSPNPVSYGAFTKVLGQFARDRGIFSLEEAVRKMTSLPAAQMQLKDRGVLKKGAFADVTVFDPKTIRNKASFANPKQFSQGIEQVLINGKLVLDKSTYRSNARAGRVLKRS